MSARPETGTDAPPPCVCGGIEYETVLSGRFNRLDLTDYEFRIARCRTCGLARTLPVPDDRQYEHDYHFVGEPHDAWSAAKAEYVARRSTGTRLLDVGCHVGNLVAAAVDRGLDAVGIDIDPNAIAAGRRLGRPVHAAGIADVDGEYDAVVLSHVAEHVVDLRSLFTHVDRVLAPGGRAFVFVPNHRGLLPRLMRERWMGWSPAQHVWHFHSGTLAQTVRATSPLKVVSWRTRGVMEPPSSGAKGRVKAAVAALSRASGTGDELEAILERHG